MGKFNDFGNIDGEFSDDCWGFVCDEIDLERKVLLAFLLSYGKHIEWSYFRKLYDFATLRDQCIFSSYDLFF